MSKRGKYSIEEKIRTAEQYINGEASAAEIDRIRNENSKVWRTTDLRMDCNIPRKRSTRISPWKWE